jgi:hypothetical protein
MAATQGRSSSTTKAANGGGISLETKKLVPVLAVLSRFPFFYIIWMSLNIVPLINGISLDSAGLAIWTRMFTDEIVGAGRTVLRRPRRETLPGKGPHARRGNGRVTTPPAKAEGFLEAHATPRDSSPSLLMFLAAFVSLSRDRPQFGQSYTLLSRGITWR